MIEKNHNIERLIGYIKSGERGGVRATNDEYVYGFGYHPQRPDGYFDDLRANYAIGIVPEENFSVNQAISYLLDDPRSKYIINHPKAERGYFLEGNKRHDYVELFIGYIFLLPEEFEAFLKSVIKPSTRLDFYRSS